jgi:hypothetical protein
MVAQSTTAGDRSENKEAMAATDKEKTAMEKAKAKDDASQEDQKIGQKASTYAGKEIPVSEDNDEKKSSKEPWKSLEKS